MLRLVAENAALEDALYYLDLGVTDSVITVEVFLKEIRRLARKQFVARATMKKVRIFLGNSEACFRLHKHERPSLHFGSPKVRLHCCRLEKMWIFLSTFGHGSVG